MTRSETTTLHDNRVILACFEVRDGVYALDVSCVREVVRCTDERVRIEFDEQIIAAAPEWIVFVAKSR